MGRAESAGAAASRATHAASGTTLARQMAESDARIGRVLSREREDGSMHTGVPPSGSSDRALRADVIGGITTFFTMAYIVVVNPAILATAGTGMPFSGAMTATVLVASSMTFLMGVYARLPFAVAP